jgi:hypothetical protein
MPRNAQVAMLLGLLDEAFERKAWHGPNLRGAIRGVTATQAAWRRAPGTHNIWELVLHAAYWKYAVRRRLTGEKRSSFDLKGSNWFPSPRRGRGSPETAEGAWRSDVARLVEQHRQLRAVVARLKDADLPKRSKGSRNSNLVLVRGIAAHDLYHAGQIQLLKRLQR